MLGYLSESQKMKQRNYCDYTAYTYKPAESNVTGFSPYYMFHGRQPPLIVILDSELSYESKQIP